MKKIDGKEYFTFVGLINRMDACRNGCCSKDIPEKVEFKGETFELSVDKKTYIRFLDEDCKVIFDLADAAAGVYGADLSKYLTEFDFVVVPKEKIILTSEEKEFIRMCNKIVNTGNGIAEIEIRGPVWFDVMELVMYCDTSCRKIDLRPGMFSSLKRNKRYTLKELRIYD